MQIIRGKVQRAQKVCIYGPEGIGKTTFAAAFPSPLFIDTEGSTYALDVARMERPTSFTMLESQVRYVRDSPGLCRTLVIDTADWAEQLCIVDVCAKAQKTGMEDFGYGKGYTFLAEQFGKLLNLLEEVVERGIHVVLTAHAKIQRFDQPDEIGSYDRWSMKLGKQTTPLVKEWCDMVLFANYKTIVVNMDGKGAQKGKNKVQGGMRVLYTAHHSCWDAKNRHDLPDEIPLDYAAIAHCIPTLGDATMPQSMESPLETANVANPEPEPQPDMGNPISEPPSSLSHLPRALADLMIANQVTEAEIQAVVTSRGYYPADTPIANYGMPFIEGVLIGAWGQVLPMIVQNRMGSVPKPQTPF